jgi:hypothetical protein
LRAALGQAAWLLDPVAAMIRQHVFAAEKIHADDSVLQKHTEGRVCMI